MSLSDALEADGAEDEAGELAVAAGSQDQQLGILTGCDQLGGGTPVCQTAASRHGTAVVEGFRDRVCLQFFGLVLEGGGVGASVLRAHPEPRLPFRSPMVAELRFGACEEFTAGIPGRVDGSIAFSSSLTDLVQESNHHPPVVGAI